MGIGSVGLPRRSAVRDSQKKSSLPQSRQVWTLEALEDPEAPEALEALEALNPKP